MNKPEETVFMRNARRANGGKLPAHLMYATKLTRYGERDMTNRKPFRNKAGRAYARSVAEKVNGAWRAIGGFYGNRPEPRSA